MPELEFQVEGVESQPFAATPSIHFKLRIRNADEQAIEAILLRSQIRIEPAGRAYNPGEKRALRDLFGEPQRWSQTLRSMLWAHSTVVVPRFEGSTVVDLPVACTFDLAVASAKYFHGLEDGDVPLCLLFSGTVFYRAEEGALQTGQIPWNKEASYRLPVDTWRQAIDCHYPNTAWLCLRRDLFERLQQYKTDRGIPTWEQALESMLP